MPTPEILDEIRQMASRLNEIADMYGEEESEEGESEYSEDAPLSSKPDKVSAAMSMFKKKGSY